MGAPLPSNALKERALTVIAAALTADSLLYAAAIAMLSYKRLVAPSVPFSSNFYFLLAPLCALAVFARPIRDMVWRLRRKSVTDAASFFQVYTATIVMGYALLDVIGIAGVIVFILTGEMRFALILVGISFAAKVAHFPRRGELIDKKHECDIP